MTRPVYDTIGRGYSATRRGDPRIAARIHAALGDARRVVNVGAGAGSYEPVDRPVVAVEPSWEMLRQRAPGAALAVRAAAEHLPFADGAFDAAMATLTVHHWADRARGLRELRRVARRVVVLTWDPACAAPGAPGSCWVTEHYVPEMLALDRPRFPTLAEVAAALGPVTVEPVPIPHDCTDGFLGAYWRRPEAYLDPAVRRPISGFAQLPPEVVTAAMARLADDLRTGDWDRRFGALRAREAIDLGYRLLITRGHRP